MKVDLIVIGGGAAGMTAAVYALRNNKSTLILESSAVGGQIAYSPKVENFPTYKEISGNDLANRLFEQVLNLGAEFELETVTAIAKLDDGTFAVGTNEGEHFAKAVIIANGVNQKHIGIEAEEKLLGRGVYYCAICDGAFYKGKEVAVIGDGNTALQSALLLSSICSKVHVLTWFDKFFGDESLVETLRSTSNINVIPDCSVTDFLGSDSLIGVKAQKKADGSFFTLEVPAVFVAIGQVPNNERFSNLVDLSKDGYIVAGEDTKTKTSGIFAAGDTRTKSVRQLTTAVADGAVSAMAAIEYIRSLK